MKRPRGSAARVIAAHVVTRRDAGAALYGLEVATLDGQTWKWRATDLATGLVLEGVTDSDTRIRRGLAAIAEQLRRAGA